MRVSLPKPVKEWIDQQVAVGGFESASEFIQHLVREARWKAGASDVDGKLLEALAAGPARPMTQADWADIRRQGRRRLARGSGRKSA